MKMTAYNHLICLLIVIFRILVISKDTKKPTKSYFKYDLVG